MNAELLFRRVLAPLCCGGELRPLPPIGRRARDSADYGELLEDPAVESARTVAARRLWPVDRLPRLGEGEWLLLAALNDLLQVPNPTLRSIWATQRHEQLLDSIAEQLSEVAPPATALEALCRYATFARALSLTRVDTQLSWWTGSRRFVGMQPPARLSAWPTLRRVRKHELRLSLPEMAPGAEHGKSRWEALLGRWLGACPLLDLMTAARATPRFAWLESSLALLEAGPARSLALRAALQAGPPGAIRIAEAAAALERAEIRGPALDFVRELQAFTGYSDSRG